MRLARPGSLTLVALGVAAACSGDETELSPVALPPTPVQDAGSDAQQIEAGPVLRTVELRNPFGNTSQVDNLLVDGDFELTSGRGQYGWRAISRGGEEGLVRETGGLCRSGVTCGVLTTAADFIAFGAAPRDAEIEASVWIKPPDPDCELVRVSLISCSSLLATSLARVSPVTAKPDEKGWCEYRAMAAAMREQPCLYVDARFEAGQRALVDDAYLGAARVAVMRRMSKLVPDRALRERMQHALRWIHEHKQFGRPQRSDEL